MSKKNITTASSTTTATTMTAAEFKQKSYDAYLPTELTATASSNAGQRAS